MLNLLELEKCFFRYSCISDRAWLEKTLHNDFMECGKSGLLSDKKDMIQSLLECKAGRNIEIYSFECRRIDYNVWIAHYITKTDEGELYYRTSVWVVCDEPQLYFHQATQLNEKVDLVKY